MITSTDNEQLFSSLGLSTREAEIYKAALELGESLQLELAQKAGIKRTTLREYLPELLNRGILQETIHGKRHYLTARDPRELVAELQAKAESALASLPLLVALQNNRLDKPRVRFFEGVAGVKQVFEETLRLGQPIYTFVDVSSLNPDLEKWLVNHYVPERHKRSIVNYVLVSQSQIVESLIPENPFRHNKIIPADQYPFKMEIDIFGDYVSLVHFSKSDEPSATLIQSQAAATTLKSIHQLIWDKY